MHVLVKLALLLRRFERVDGVDLWVGRLVNVVLLRVAPAAVEEANKLARFHAGELDPAVHGDNLLCGQSVDAAVDVPLPAGAAELGP